MRKDSPELYASIPDVFVPKVYPDLSTGKVLTMEWVEGARLSDEASISRMGLDSSKLVDILVQCSLRQMLENGSSTPTRTEAISWLCRMASYVFLTSAWFPMSKAVSATA